MRGIYWKTTSSLLLLIISFATTFGQYKEGVITYERRTNLFKKYDGNVREWLKEKNKIKIDIFELSFTDTSSIFRVQDSDLSEEFSWATSKNVVKRDLNSPNYYAIKDVWGDQVHISDVLPKRDWKLTESKRNIAGYDCRKAFWEVNDSLKIYAWYCDEIIPSVGPETFYGLPGAILGLASEDGSVIYFAKSVVLKQPKADVFKIKTSKKAKPLAEIRESIELVMSRNKWWKSNIEHFFIW